MKNLKKLFVCLMFLLSVVGADNLTDTGTTVYAASKKVSLNKDKVTIYVGKSTTLKIKGTNKKVKWLTNNKKIAAVNSKGKVTGKKAGKAKITAKVLNKSYKCAVTVKNVKVTDVTIDKTTDVLYVGSSIKLNAIIKPDNATNKTVIWSSSDEAVATVSEDGNVLAIKNGDVVITATSGGKTGSILLTVKNVEVESVILNEEEKTVYVGDKVKLIATVKPENATDKSVTWTSTDESVATVSDDGIVTALKKGYVNIVATSGNKTESCFITINNIEVESIILNETEKTVYVGDTTKLSATIKPENATDKTIKWSSSNEMVATVSNDGIVTAVKSGTVVITAKSGSESGTCVVTIENVDVTNVTLNEAEKILYIGDVLNLEATIKPDNATDKTVKWSTSDGTVATVSKDGKVTAIKAGTVTITATSGTVSGSCVITVKNIEVSNVALNETERILYIGESVRLEATVEPENATDKTVIWKSSDDTVVAVSDKGTVTAKKEGVATITATSGEKSESCDVTVRDLGKEVEIIEEYTLPDEYGWYVRHFMVVKNNSTKTVKISTSSLAYDSDGAMVSVADGSLNALGAGCISVFYEPFKTDKEISFYETTIMVKEDTYYKSIIQDLTYKKNDIDKGAIFQVTNNGENPAEYVYGYALFFMNGVLVDYDAAYFTDDDSELKSGATISKQITTSKNFDKIEFYLTGRY